MGRLVDARGNPLERAPNRDSQIEFLSEALADAARAERHADVSESLAQAELDLEDKGWIKVSQQGAEVMTRAGVQSAVKLARSMFIMNPLIKQAVRLQSWFVFGKGLKVHATDPKVNELVQAFWRRNRRTLSAQSRLAELDQELSNAGNLFFVLFPSKDTTDVDLRVVPVDQITDIITDPDDDATPWYYIRRWTPRVTAGSAIQAERTEAHPALDYSPVAKPTKLSDGPVVRWDAPIHHVKSGGTLNSQFGIPESYGAINWALAYVRQLSDWSAVVRSLRRFAWNAKTTGSPTALRDRMRSSLALDGGSSGTTHETNPAPASGSIFASSAGVEFQPIKTQGASISPEDSKMLRHMVAANFGVSDPHLSMDVQQGALATAKDLNQPMFLKYQQRQQFWKEHLIMMLEWVTAFGLTTNGVLGTDTDDAGDRVTVDVPSDIDMTIDIIMPPIREDEVGEIVKAIVTAGTLDGKPIAPGIFDTETLRRLLLSALAERDITVQDGDLEQTVSALAEAALIEAATRLESKQRANGQVEQAGHVDKLEVLTK